MPTLFFVTRDFDLWPFDPEINGFPWIIVEHLYVTFGELHRFLDTTRKDRHTDKQRQNPTLTTAVEVGNSNNNNNNEYIYIAQNKQSSDALNTTHRKRTVLAYVDVGSRAADGGERRHRSSSTVVIWFSGPERVQSTTMTLTSLLAYDANITRR